MQVRELRIGNYVQYTEDEMDYNITIKKDIIVWKKGDTCVVDDEMLLTMRNYNDTVKPIPLTKEWLLKFGFTKENLKPTDQHTEYYSIGVADCKYSFSYADFREDWGFYQSCTDAHKEIDNNRFDFVSCGIKSVHQLQNLYFALTEEELKLKEN